MATIEKFEDLMVWQKARELVKFVYQVTSKNPFASDFSLVGQCRRSAISVVSNIAEGFERKGNREFIQFLFIALGSNAELKTQLLLAHDLSYIGDDEKKEIISKSDEVGKMINGLLNYLKESNLRGTKFN